MTLKLESTTTWTQKRLKLGMVSSFDPHNMCAKVERNMTKTGCTSCTNWTISFKVQWFLTKNHLLQRHFIFLSLFQLKTFFASKHFVYKLDHLFQSTRVSDKNSSITKTFHFSKLISTQDFFASNMQHSKPHTEISTLSDFICYFSCIYLFIF